MRYRVKPPWQECCVRDENFHESLVYQALPGLLTRRVDKQFRFNTNLLDLMGENAKA
jgi:hypothetical protein